MRENAIDPNSFLLFNLEVRIVLSILLLAGFSALAQTDAVHKWILKSGANYSGNYISSGTTMVVIKADGTNCLIKITDLSTNDLIYIYECKSKQRQAQFDIEATQLQAKGMIELNEKLIENFPEKVNQQSGWMDCEFIDLNNIYTSEDEDYYLGFEVADKNGDWFAKCVVVKNILGPNFMNGDNSDQKHNPLVEYISGLKRHDKIRLIGTVSAPLGTSFRRFEVQKVEMIETATDADAIKKLQESVEDN
jgi:hypothetical protein